MDSKEELIKKAKEGGLVEVNVPQSAIDYIRARAAAIKIVNVKDLKKEKKD